ncbi:3-methyl-2-oxobutanoate hydroxymethyltransferase [Paenibacillus sp. 481]|uniref:3-methyl-2-oxobutanoate hydroxymethyltransferase n=1 Tax=Paenibacillus sp. 481 TaxID=2835869 RepID=UPI001E4F73FC|nr:3-methyl-2-oxobutanoate hydroxymethyltransferase [Paenibacillus sp. 481]UHA72993.1 3-methyl-2-oxobutanoate hydroxymethyltransferase [Paenibacillus sp. 481]
MTKNKQPLTIVKMKTMKQQGDKIAMVTAYDYPSAALAEQADVDMILVGDSLGNVVLGYDSTLPVTLDDMVYHTRAVRRGAPNTFVVTDMPFMTYHSTVQETMYGVRRLMQEGFANAVKMEGGSEIALMVDACVKAGVPVLGHIGLTPQSVHQLGGYRIQGKTPEDAKRLLEDALALERAGAFGIVLELVTDQVAAYISERLSIPTIGIGAGAQCDGQVLVYHDILRYDPSYREKKMVKTYADIGATVRESIQAYVQDVKQQAFPAPEHTFSAGDEVVESLYGNANGTSVSNKKVQHT